MSLYPNVQLQQRGRGPLIVDFHVHPKRGGKVVIDEIIAELDRWDVSQAVLLGRDSDPADLDRSDIRNWIVVNLLTSPSAPPEYRTDPTSISTLVVEMRSHLARVTTNKEVAGCVKAYPGRFVGLGSINIAKDEGYVKEKLRSTNWD